MLPRSWQDYPTARTQDVTPTDVGPPSPNSMSLVLQDEVPLAKTKPTCHQGIMIENHVLTTLKYKK